MKENVRDIFGGSFYRSPTARHIEQFYHHHKYIIKSVTEENVRKPLEEEKAGKIRTIESIAAEQKRPDAEEPPMSWLCNRHQVSCSCHCRHLSIVLTSRALLEWNQMYDQKLSSAIGKKIVVNIHF